MGEMGKRIWKVVRGVLFMVREGIISKGKMMMGLKYFILKRRKSLLFHSYDHQPRGHFEFSCTNTPKYSYPKKKYPLMFKEVEVDADADADAVAVAPNSPYLPGFGRTPLVVRPLRITDSPFPLKDEDYDDGGFVDKAAEDFIHRFYLDLINQKKRTYH